MKNKLSFAFLLIWVIAIPACNSDSHQETQDYSNANSLINTVWMLQSIEIPDSTIITVDTSKIFSIQFFEDFNLNGINDCNEYYGTYTVSGNYSLSIDSLGTSFKNCGGSIDGEHFRALYLVHSYSIIDNKLNLYFEENNPILKYYKSDNPISGTICNV